MRPRIRLIWSRICNLVVPRVSSHAWTMCKEALLCHGIISSSIESDQNIPQLSLLMPLFCMSGRLHGNSHRLEKPSYQFQLLWIQIGPRCFYFIYLFVFYLIFVSFFLFCFVCFFECGVCGGGVCVWRCVCCYDKVIHGNSMNLDRIFHLNLRREVNHISKTAKMND